MDAGKQQTDQLRQMLDQSRRMVVFTGAGISTESGIPDFRSPGGIWSKNEPINYQDFISSEKTRIESWRRRFALGEVLDQARPNAGHLAVAKLVQRNKAACVITQNIDGLHQQAGVPDDKVIELHGNTHYAVCLECGKRFELVPIRQAFEQKPHAPVCDLCGGMVKTATVSFGQSMPAAEMHAAREQTVNCDLFLSLGSSLVVYPAAGFPEIAKRNNARLAIINRDPTGMDHLADLVIHDSIGPVLAAAVDPE